MMVDGQAHLGKIAAAAGLTRSPNSAKMPNREPVLPNTELTLLRRGPGPRNRMKAHSPDLLLRERVPEGD